jgi:hypothetical protein
MTEEISFANAHREEGISKIVEVFSWLAKLKSDLLTGTGGYYINAHIWENNEIKDCDKMLLHWLVYITDRGKNADVLWPNNTPKLKSIINKFNDILKKGSDFENALNFQELKIAAFPNDLLAIEKTLFMLFHLKQNFIEFLSEHIMFCRKRDENNVYQNIANVLYLLSYSNTSTKRKNPKAEWNDDLLKLRDKKYFSIEKKSFYHKRISSALRDYANLDKEYNPFKLLSNESQNQILIPGDMWNKEFYNICFTNLLDSADNFDWRLISDEFKKRGYNPVDYDASFSFTRKMCKGRFCKICIFGQESHIKKACIGDWENTKEKFCPVAIILNDSYIYCSRMDCKIKKLLDIPGPCSMPKINE